jgi:restriction system protein
MTTGTMAAPQAYLDAHTFAQDGASDDVSIAVDLLLEEMGDAIDVVSAGGVQAIQRGDFGTATELIQKASQATALRERVRELERAWVALREGKVAKTLNSIRREHPVSGRARRGQRTPEEAFRLPLLQTLVELGGRAKVNAVIDRVGNKLAGRLNEFDLAPVASNPNEIRWRNAVKWCRNTLVGEGLLAADSPRGEWEVTDAGRRLIEQQARTSSQHN